MRPEAYGRPGSYQRSANAPAPGDNTPRIINNRAGKSYRNRRPGPDHSGPTKHSNGGRKGIWFEQSRYLVIDIY